MTFRHLEIFVKVAETLSMTSAAELLFIAQSSVSQSISELEQHLKAKLFERLGRKLYLTENGNEFLSYARHIVSLAADAEMRMREMRKGGTLRIGGSMTVGTTILYRLIQSFVLDNSTVDLTVTVDNTSVLESMLLANKIDLAIAEGKMKSGHIVSRVIMDDELVFICPTHHRFANVDYVNLTDLISEKFILREEGSGTRELFESVMAAHDLQYTVKGVMNNTEAIKLAVAGNLGIAAISVMSIKEELASGELACFRVEGLNFSRNFSLFFHKNKFFTPVMEAFMNLCYIIK